MEGWHTVALADQHANPTGANLNQLQADECLPKPVMVVRLDWEGSLLLMIGNCHLNAFRW